jgi:hypothetical protein
MSSTMHLDLPDEGHFSTIMHSYSSLEQEVNYSKHKVHTGRPCFPLTIRPCAVTCCLRIHPSTCNIVDIHSSTPYSKNGLYVPAYLSTVRCTSWSYKANATDWVFFKSCYCATAMKVFDISVISYVRVLTCLMLKFILSLHISCYFRLCWSCLCLVKISEQLSALVRRESDCFVLLSCACFL